MKFKNFELELIMSKHGRTTEDKGWKQKRKQLELNQAHTRCVGLRYFQ